MYRGKYCDENGAVVYDWLNDNFIGYLRVDWGSVTYVNGIIVDFDSATVIKLKNINSVDEFLWYFLGMISVFVIKFINIIYIIKKLIIIAFLH